MKILLYSLIILFCYYPSFSQNYKLKNFKLANYDALESVLVDSNANAYVIEEIGKSRLEAFGSDNELKLIHEYAIRIKILNKEGYDYANFKIPLYKSGTRFDIISSINGKTYNKINGQITVSELSKENIYIEKYSDNIQFSKITFPNIKEGSVIELKYQITSDRYFGFKSWEYQDYIPKLYSEYTTEIPKNFVYNISYKGRVPITEIKKNVKPGCLILYGEPRECVQNTYIIKNVPAFQREDFMLSPINYLAAINYELMRLQDDNGIPIKSFTRDWKNVEELFNSSEDFGLQLKKTNHFKKIIAPVIEGKTSNYEKAKAIYSYIQNQIKWNNVYGCYTQKGVEESIKSRTGNVADINFSLINALNAANIEAYPVVLSTRDNGLPNLFSPVISDFNYVIAVVNFDSLTYYLDATDAFNPFNELPLRAINHNGRAIYPKKDSEWLTMVNNVISSTNYIFDGELLEEGDLKGVLTYFYSGMDAFNKRKEIINAGSEETFKEELQTAHTMQIDGIEIFNLKEIDNNLTIKMNVKTKLFDMKEGMNKEFSFSPILLNRITKNPFNLDERTYPVDLGAKRSNNFEIRIRMPESMTIKEKPNNISLALPDRAARYVFNTKFDNHTLSINQSFSLNRNIYLENEYLHLKEFYSRLIQHQKLEILVNKD